MAAYYFCFALIIVLAILCLLFIFNCTLNQPLPMSWQLLFVTVMALSTLGLYGYLGDAKGLADYYATQSRQREAKKLAGEFHDPTKVITRMETILKKHPRSAKGWYLLGRLYYTQGELEKAIHAYQQSLTYKQQSTTLLHYAIALYVQNGKQINPAVQTVLDTLLHYHPQDPDVLVFIAQDAISHGQSQKALHYLKQLRKQAVDEASLTRVDEMISKVSKTLIESEKHIVVHVALANKIQTYLHPSASVFIYAKALNGPNMPLAVVRRHVSDLPLDVILSTHDAIIPNNSLANHTIVKIIARVSITGNAKVSRGDWYGEHEINTLQQETKTRVIIKNPVTQDHIKL